MNSLKKTKQEITSPIKNKIKKQAFKLLYVVSVFLWHDFELNPSKQIAVKLNEEN